MGNPTDNHSDGYAQPRPEGGCEVVTGHHDRASAVTRGMAEAVGPAREIVTNLAGGEVRIKNRDNRFTDSDTQGRRHESPARDGR